jgi:hypothetical protein
MTQRSPGEDQASGQQRRADQDTGANDDRQSGQDEPGARGRPDPVGQPVLGPRARGGGLVTVGIAGPDPEQRGHGKGGRDRYEGQQPEKDPPPADQRRDACGQGRADQARHDPGRGQYRHHPGAQVLGQAAPDGNVGHRGYRASADALEGPAGD